MFGKSNISRTQREMIAVVVSSVNKCHYWIEHHGAALQKLINDKNLAEQIKLNYKKLIFQKKEKSILSYAKKLTHKFTFVQKSDVDNLKENNFSDTNILDINQVI